jgi:hypothetical protein
MPHPLADALRDLSQAYNYAEVLIWPVMGVVLFAAAARRRGPVRRDFLLAGAVLLAFGASDYAEAENGNRWWEPWWLLLWKAACVAALLAVLGVAWRREQAGRRPAVAPAAGTGDAAADVQSGSGEGGAAPRQAGL